MGNAFCGCQSDSATKQKKNSQQQRESAGNEGDGQGQISGHAGGGGGSSANISSMSHYASLPFGALKATVHHVYDGDTLTINQQNRARVRLLGVDAPELKEREPYAEDSANYLKKLCPPNGTIWLVHDKEKTDRYDRLLAYIYVVSAGGNGYTCVNIAMLESGLGGFYAPGKSNLAMRSELMKAEASARKMKLHIWKNVKLNGTVYVTRNGSAFHKQNCDHVGSARLTPMTISEALDKGLNPCRTCKPM